MLYNTSIMRRLASAALLCALSVLLSASASADVFEMRSGELITGKFMGGSQNTVRVQIGSTVRVIPVADVLAITFDARPAATAAPAPVTPAAQPAPVAPAGPPPPKPPAGVPGPGAAAPAPAGSAAASESFTVPAGTMVPVRLSEGLDSNRHGNGHRFTGRLEGNLMVGTQLAVPKGSTVYGRVVAAKKSRRLFGRSEFSIELTGISIGGTIVPITTNDYAAVTENTTKRSLRTVARGAAIGGLANGSKGARDGAKIGAGVAILTRGNSLHVPAGTLLEFRLASALAR